ncbi:uncharacterized protein [Lepeophtheirus salmonis]|uniref:uncharacterized protein n=1 Tax=Lepeophtheirus salmonis TaxID=72036 RepID=UPI001AE81F5D|nr:ankyrin repeat family A protein 2-like [Lepeophtheirus salmonis]
MSHHLIMETIKEEDPIHLSHHSIPPPHPPPKPKKFWPEKPSTEKIKANTVLTNLQRGNIPTMQTIVEPESIRNLHQRAGQGELTATDILSNDPNLLDASGKSLLMWASSYGQTPTVSLLLRHGADSQLRARENETALHLAASHGHHDTVKVLLAHGAQVDALDENACTPLMFAALMNHPHSVNELILYHADITLTNINGDTAYSLASLRKSDLARAVIENSLISLLKRSKN